MKNFCALICAVLICGCVRIEYQGKTAEPLPDDIQVAVFKDAGRITRAYTVLGTASAAGDYREVGSDRMIAKLREKAAECGANAILVTEHLVIAKDIDTVTASPKFTGESGRIDRGSNWDAVAADSDYNLVNTRRSNTVTTAGSINNFTRIIRAEFIRY